MRIVEIVLHNIILKSFKEKKMFSTHIQTVDLPDLKVLSMGLNSIQKLKS